MPLDSVTAGSCSELRTHAGVGFPVANLGDLDGDGVSDYALSNANAVGGGIVYVHSGKSGALLFEVTGDGTPSLNGELFGFAIARIGDVGSASGGPPSRKLESPNLSKPRVAGKRVLHAEPASPAVGVNRPGG